MKVLDLRCGDEHAFEGWFASEGDFVAQHERGDIACPMCGSVEVHRLPSAPRISMHRGMAAPATRPTAPGVNASSETPSTAMTMQATMQAQWLRAVRHVLQSTEDVGERFAEEARKIHYGESEERGIRGKASRADAEALHAEGIEVVSLPIPDALKGPVQ